MEEKVGDDADDDGLMWLIMERVLAEEEISGDGWRAERWRKWCRKERRGGDRDIMITCQKKLELTESECCKNMSLI